VDLGQSDSRFQAGFRPASVMDFGLIRVRSWVYLIIMYAICFYNKDSYCAQQIEEKLPYSTIVHQKFRMCFQVQLLQTVSPVASVQLRLFSVMNCHTNSVSRQTNNKLIFATAHTAQFKCVVFTLHIYVMIIRQHRPFCYRAGYHTLYLLLFVTVCRCLSLS